MCSAPLGQIITHNPQSKQVSSFITGIFPTSAIAFKTHTLKHAPLSEHLSNPSHLSATRDTVITSP